MAWIIGNYFYPGASVFYTFRILRAFKLLLVITAWKNFRVLIQTAWTSLVEMRNFLILLALHLTISSILGSQLFAYRVLYHRETDQPIPSGAT